MTRILKFAHSASVTPKPAEPDSGQAPVQPPPRDQRRIMQFATQVERSDDLVAHAPKHEEDGADPADVDKFRSDYVPSNYERTVNSQSTTARQVASHLKGIDDKLGTISAAAAAAQATANTASTNAAYARPIWEWNKTNTSQFDGSPAFEANLNSRSLSVVANSAVPGGNVLRFAVNSAPGTANQGVCVWLITQTLPLSYRMELEVLPLVVTNNPYWGFAYLADKTGNYHGYHSVGGTARGKFQVNDGVLDVMGAANGLGDWTNSTVASQIINFKINADKVNGMGPRFFAESRVTQVAVTTAPTGGANRQSDFPTSPVGSSWNTLACTRGGLCFRSSNTSGSIVQLDIVSWRIYQL